MPEVSVSAWPREHHAAAGHQRGPMPEAQRRGLAASAPARTGSPGGQPRHNRSRQLTACPRADHAGYLTFPRLDRLGNLAPAREQEQSRMTGAPARLQILCRTPTRPGAGG